MTGTRFAYHPPGSILRGGVRAPATGDYEAWTPEMDGGPGNGR
jgi:NADH:ubiquinone oxidoreductase subunit